MPPEAYKLYPHDNLSRSPETSNAFFELQGNYRPIRNHVGNFFDCVKSRNTPISDVFSQHRSVSTCHLATISMRLGRKLTWDPNKELFVGDDEANRWLRRQQRRGYEIKA